MATETDTRRIALISDVHGNLPAFRAVLRAIEEESPDAIWCLGDLVGYGAHPNECVELSRQSVDLCLRGNHDSVVIDRLDISEFSANAAAAAEWTKGELTAESRAYLEACDEKSEQEAIGLYHASPRDPTWEYVLSAMIADDCFDAMEPRVGAVGHSHVAVTFMRRGDTPTLWGQPEANETIDFSDDRWLLNPGSVGQPRDGDPRASWLLLELESWRATWRRTEYPIDEAAEAIRAARLPEQLADRLYYGQ
ncbi:MAG TPA: metallophosphoesterase family protein [Thermoleophilaceae bacterium]|nr:metallophosphoesterase family protein [Thermoleophilaceae bacterium]